MFWLSDHTKQRFYLLEEMYGLELMIILMTWVNIKPSNIKHLPILVLSFEATSVIDQSVVYHNQRFFVFGGYPTNDAIGCLDAHTYEWSLAGQLLTGRYFHRVIHDGENFLVIGGRVRENHEDAGLMKTENCNYANKTMTCTEQYPWLYEYRGWPELYLVHDDFCAP